MGMRLVEKFHRLRELLTNRVTVIMKIFGRIGIYFTTLQHLTVLILKRFQLRLPTLQTSKDVLMLIRHSTVTIKEQDIHLEKIGRNQTDHTTSSLESVVHKWIVSSCKALLTVLLITSATEQSEI